MIKVQYFANFVDDVAVTMSDISQNCTGSPNFCGVLGSNGFQSTLERGGGGGGVCGGGGGGGGGGGTMVVVVVCVVVVPWWWWWCRWCGWWWCGWWWWYRGSGVGGGGTMVVVVAMWVVMCGCTCNCYHNSSRRDVMSICNLL